MKIGKNIQNKKSAHFDNKIGTVGKKKKTHCKHNKNTYFHVICKIKLGLKAKRMVYNVKSMPY